MHTLKIKNGDLEALIRITSVSLSFERSRARNKFLQVIAPLIEARDKSKKEIIEKFSIKDEEGKTKLTAQGLIDFGDNMKEVDAEWAKLQGEDAVIDVLPSIEKELQVVKDIIVSSEEKLSPEDSFSLTRIVEAIEAIK